MTAFAVRADIRALALSVAITLRWPEHDLEALRSSKDPAVRRAFGNA